MAQSDFTRINTNIGAFNALNSLKSVQKDLGIRQLRLATGKRINEAADDPAGLTIATKFQYRASGMGVALDNIGDAKNMLAVAEGGLSKINDILMKMRDKAEQAASDTLGDTERTAIKDQLTQWSSEIDSIVGTTKWNGKKLLDGLSGFRLNGSVREITFQVGADTTADDRIQMTSSTFGAVDAASLGIASTAAAATAGTDADTTAAISAAATAAVPNGMTELASGTYTIEFNAATPASTVVVLKDSAGNAMGIDTNADGVVQYSATLDLDTAGTAINFRNGLSVTVNALTAAGGDGAGNYTATVTYARTGSFNGDVSDATNARTAMDSLDTAITEVSDRLQTVGSLVSRLNFREETVTTAKVNVEAAQSRIMNADMAYEQLEATKLQILQQTSTAMLAQANSAPQGILSLFR